MTLVTAAGFLKTCIFHFRDRRTDFNHLFFFPSTNHLLVSFRITTKYMNIICLLLKQEMSMYLN